MIKKQEDDAFVSEIIRMAWADEISFDRIKREKGLSEAEVIQIMRSQLKPSSFRLWRKRVSGRVMKHEKKAKLVKQQEVPERIHPQLLEVDSDNLMAEE